MTRRVRIAELPSGPVTVQDSSNGVNKDKLSLLQLINEKERVEAELSTLGSVLDSHSVNMNTGLTTFDGFPRSDIDVAQIRTTRARIIHLRNDYKDLMSRIEKGLHAHHANQITQNGSSTPPSSRPVAASAPSAPDIQGSTTGIPFAKVNSVVSGSPADETGMKVGDLITQFGSVNWANHEKLAKVAEAVASSEGRPIQVELSRTGERVSVQLTPRRDWGGRGLLGCHLLPV
ncbi:hypothetical protein EJ05DRAFT_537950 [Pseudovirgaria hyperparasitica]|uniref:Probable 26S proteasome regulatory subunit p27 n=1 Tax=Pseudovirgaria hyperparasitica TaxID=470096 RepID=A0A6A6W6V7_9PEZI|nr:uncharacterized protein EJ05DRAFT_537950 [Pseudovirgaria hyperparasitica]KAF2758618.1 hypothetical protein EJ05DRAFT_537950 [Pseudovirgaria hyperparasitica]